MLPAIMRLAPLAWKCAGTAACSAIIQSTFWSAPFLLPYGARLSVSDRAAVIHRLTRNRALSEEDRWLRRPKAKACRPPAQELLVGRASALERSVRAGFSARSA